VTLLGLLDLSAAFDCVDHTLLLQRLAHQHGLTGVVLQVAYDSIDGQLSSVQLFRFGMPKGSILGPLMFVMYTAELHQGWCSAVMVLHCTSMQTIVKSI